MDVKRILPALDHLSSKIISLKSKITTEVHSPSFTTEDHEALVIAAYFVVLQNSAISEIEYQVKAFNQKVLRVDNDKKGKKL
ncbi:hypothetical protein L6452_36968 [Arctium lappa]|uniref:Uncharacterized protein n=1 Tax=Arctium lappa TaxID=4217 RepID=A0ACB8Y1P9_ARCLA|nr:hypothetical protein L6452_36968 [Arctium lappa]